MPLQIRRGTEAERQALASTPQSGELIYVTDTKQLYVGDGTNLLSDLTPITGYTDENAVDALGAVLSGSSHSGITFSYDTNDDNNDRIVATVSYGALQENLNLNNFDITGNGNITITGNLTINGLLTADYRGSIFADNSTLLVNAVDSKIELDGTVKGNIIPDVSEAYDIGSMSQKFKDLYLSGTSLWLGSAQVTASGTAINLPAGSTVGGTQIMGGDEAVISDIQGSVFGDDSSVLVDAVNNSLNTSVLTIQDSVLSTTETTLQVGNDADFPMIVKSLQGASSLKEVTFNYSSGTVENPSDVDKTKLIGGFAVKGYADGVYKSSLSLATSYTSSATLTDDNPNSYAFIGTNAGGSSFNIFGFRDVPTFVAPTVQLGTFNPSTGAVTQFADAAARDAAITSPEAGMMCFIADDGTSGGAPAVPRFQGHDGSGWVNLN